MQTHLNIALVQTDLKWESPESNLEMFGALIKGLPSETDLVVLPEMFSTGFTMFPQKIAENMDGPTLN
ncbi:MAG: nitrilase family protein, partial [Bacteroidia bacterium]|nr:nitrilase family protein [Bacteroidia bacterium]